MLCQRSMMRPVGVHMRLPRASASGCTSRHCNVVGRRLYLATAPRSRSAQNRTDEPRASLSAGGARRQGLWRRASCRGSLRCRAGDDAPGPIVSDDGQDSSADSVFLQGPSAAVPLPLTDDDSATSNGAAPLRLISGFYAIPHPDKMEKGGEDSHFIGENGLAIGVADGVGGWGELGVDSGLYSKELMINADAKAQEDDAYDDQAPLTILEKAHAKTKAQGSATALVACLGDQRVYAANIGDSGLMMIREGKVMFLTPTQQHDFNFPFQLGSERSASDPPSAAMLFGIDVEVGDVLVAGTDGWLDNVFPEETAAIVARAQERGYDPYRCAELIGGFARARADDKRVITPFAKGAMETGFFWQGGKLDDITVVCSFVVAAER